MSAPLHYAPLRWVKVMRQADVIQFDFSDIDFSRWRADRAYMEAVIERAAHRRRVRLVRLQERGSALREAKAALYRLSEAGSHPYNVRLRRRFVRLQTRRERDVDPERQSTASWSTSWTPGCRPAPRH